MNTQLWAIALVISGCCLSSFGPILLKKAADKLTFKIKSISNLIDIIKTPCLLGGILSYAVGTVFFLIALKGGELSTLYPLVATVYIWVSLWAVKFLNEKMNSQKWIGIILIIIGVIFIGLGA